MVISFYSHCIHFLLATNEQTEDTYQIQNQESFKRRGVQVKVSMDSASESPTTQNTSEVPKEKEIKYK